MDERPLVAALAVVDQELASANAAIDNFIRVARTKRKESDYVAAAVGLIVETANTMNCTEPRQLRVAVLLAVALLKLAEREEGEQKQGVHA